MERERREAARQARAAAPKPEKPFPPDYDDQAFEVIRAVEPWTMTSREKLFALVLSVRHVVRHDIPGEVVECGVWRGGSMQAVARTLLQLGVTDRGLHLFDTFEGMPPPSEEDLRQDGRSAAQMLATSDRSSAVWAYATLDDVRDGMSRIAYPPEQVHYVPGLVEETVPAHAPERISILRLDTDWYASTKHELEHLYHRLSPGGILIIDDYGYWQGSRKAVAEFLDSTGERLLLLRISSGRIAVKPG